MKRLFFGGVLLTLLGGLPIAAAVAASRPTTAQGWVERVTAAYGGRSQLEKVHSLVFQGHITALMREDKGTETISLQRPRHLRTVIRYSRSGEERILNGHRVWRNFGAGFRRVSGPGALAVLYQYRHLDLPMGLLDGHYRMSLSEQKINGRTFPVLHLNDPQGPPMLVTIDPDTALIRRVAGVFKIRGHTTQLAVDYDDYRRVEGILLPHRMVNYAGGMKIAVAVFDRVRVNAPLPAALFRP